MDKNLDFEKLVEQAQFLSQLMNSGMFSAGETKADEPYESANSPDAGAAYAGAFSSENGSAPVPEGTGSQEAIDKAIQAVKLFQALSQSGQTSDNDSAYDNTSVHNDFTEEAKFSEDTREENNRHTEEAYTDFSRLYDETFTTPSIKALKSAVRFIDPSYHKMLGMWIKFLEMQNMLQVYAKRAADGYERPEYADWRRGLLLAVRPYISREKQCTIDFLIKLIELKEIISMMEEVKNGG